MVLEEEEEVDEFPVVTKYCKQACEWRKSSQRQREQDNSNDYIISATNIEEIVSTCENFIVLKRCLKHSDERVLKHSHDLLFNKFLKDAKSCDTRMKTVGIIRKLTMQSKYFRELTMERMNEFLRFGLGVSGTGGLTRNGAGGGSRRRTSSESNLPGKKEKKEVLRQIAFESLEKWGKKFGAQFPQIEIAKQFVTENLGDEAPEAKAKYLKEEEEKREKEVQERLLQKWQDVKDDVPTLIEDSHEVVFGARACFEILFNSTKTNNDDDEEFEEEEEIEWEDVVVDDEEVKTSDNDDTETVRVKSGKTLTTTTTTTTTTTAINGDDKNNNNNNNNNSNTIYLCETEDNAAVLEDLRGFYVSARQQLLPKLSSHLKFLGRFANPQLQNERARCINQLGEVKKKIIDIIERCDALNLIPLEKRQKLNKIVMDGDYEDIYEGEEGEEEESPIVQAGLMPIISTGENALRQSSNINQLLERANQQRRRRPYYPPAPTVSEAHNTREKTVKLSNSTIVAQQMRDHNEEVLALAGTRAEMGICEENAEQIRASEKLAQEMQNQEVHEYKETLKKSRKKGSAKDRIQNKLRLLKRAKNSSSGRCY
jgi:hypothetical protein